MAGTERDTFKIVGVDLAAQANKTASCTISVETGKARVCNLKSARTHNSDEGLLGLFSGPGVARIGIDAPFGWPVPFVRAVSVHQCANRWPTDDPGVYPGPDHESAIEYRDLKYRATDLHVWEETGKKPLSVATELISSVAMRAASLLSRAPRCLEVDRSGKRNHFVEVYPAAAFVRWNLCTDGYKKDSVRPRKEGDIPEWKNSLGYKRRRSMIKCLTQDLTLDCSVEHLAETDHAVDALTSAIVALMAELDRRHPDGCPLLDSIPAGLEGQAGMEGWIALPCKDSLERLGEALKGGIT